MVHRVPGTCLGTDTDGSQAATKGMRNSDAATMRPPSTCFNIGIGTERALPANRTTYHESPRGR